MILSSGGKLPSIQGLVACEVSFTNDNSMTNLICSLFCCFVMICKVKSVACMNLSSIRADLFYRTVHIARFSAFICSCCVQVFLWLNISSCSLPDAVFCICESSLHSFINKTFCLTVSFVCGCFMVSWKSVWIFCGTRHKKQIVQTFLNFQIRNSCSTFTCVVF